MLYQLSYASAAGTAFRKRNGKIESGPDDCQEEGRRGFDAAAAVPYQLGRRNPYGIGPVYLGTASVRT